MSNNLTIPAPRTAPRVSALNEAVSAANPARSGFDSEWDAYLSDIDIHRTAWHAYETTLLHLRPTDLPALGCTA